jgi:hypothetical protein
MVLHFSQQRNTGPSTAITNSTGFHTDGLSRRSTEVLKYITFRHRRWCPSKPRAFVVGDGWLSLYHDRYR